MEYCLDSFDDGKAFLILVQDCFLNQHVSEHTRGANIILDLILIIDTKINDRQCESDRTIG